MSNSIWHKRDETPKDFCDVVLANFATGSYCVFLSPFNNLSFNYDRWCYFDELLAQANKAERLQKGIDLLFRQATVWSWQTAPTPDKKIVLSRRQILGWLRKLKEIVEGQEI